MDKKCILDITTDSLSIMTYVYCIYTINILITDVRDMSLRLLQLHIKIVIELFFTLLQ